MNRGTGRRFHGSVGASAAVCIGGVRCLDGMTWREARGDGKRFFRCAASAQAVGGAKLRTMDEDLTSYRNLFPITRESHYLNHAAVSPTSTRVRDAAQDWLSDLVHHGMANIVDWIRRERETRASAARILGACVDEIAFIRSTSHGLSTFAEGIDWKPGDEVAVCTALEFPANVYPWMHLESRGVVVRPIDETEGGVVAEAVAKALGPRTRVVSVSSVEFATGVATDLEAIGASGYGFQIELTYRAHQLGFRIQELPIIFVDRAIGESKMSGGIVGEAMLMVWKLRFSRRATSSRRAFL